MNQPQWNPYNQRYVPAPQNHPAYTQPVQPWPVRTVNAPIQQPVMASAVHVKRRQSIKTHLVLAVTTMGVGNNIYAKLCNSDTLSKYKA